MANSSVDLRGAPAIAKPISNRFASMMLLGGLFLTSAVVLSIPMSGSRQVDGVILPDAGMIEIRPPRTGVVSRVYAQESQLVRRGSTLAIIDVEDVDRAGRVSQEELLSSLDRQQRAVLQQERDAQAEDASERAGLAVRIASLTGELQELDSQIKSQAEIVRLRQAEFTLVQDVAKRGFISRREINVREESLLSGTQQLAALKQARASKVGDISQTKESWSSSSAHRSGERAAIAANLSQIERDRIRTLTEHSFLLKSPVSGRVTALSLHEGQSVNTTDTAMTILPTKALVIAKLYIPMRAIGFVRVGQSVDVALDPFPRDKFGSVQGTISSISAVPDIIQDRAAKAGIFYTATVALPHPFLVIDGERRVPLPGTTLRARISVESRSLLGWLKAWLFSHQR